ncbi:unnamed protein product, partial [Notodromas monacha]
MITRGNRHPTARVATGTRSKTKHLPRDYSLVSSWPWYTGDQTNEFHLKENVVVKELIITFKEAVLPDNERKYAQRSREGEKKMKFLWGKNENRTSNGTDIISLRFRIRFVPGSSPEACLIMTSSELRPESQLLFKFLRLMRFAFQKWGPISETRIDDIPSLLPERSIIQGPLSSASKQYLYCFICAVLEALRIAHSNVVGWLVNFLPFLATLSHRIGALCKRRRGSCEASSSSSRSRMANELGKVSSRGAGDDAAIADPITESRLLSDVPHVHHALDPEIFVGTRLSCTFDGNATKCGNLILFLSCESCSSGGRILRSRTATYLCCN